MKLYVEMDELQYEKYKESLKKPKALTDLPSEELTRALLEVIKKEGGRLQQDRTHDIITSKTKVTSAAKLIKSGLSISIIIEELDG